MDENTNQTPVPDQAVSTSESPTQKSSTNKFIWITFFVALIIIGLGLGTYYLANRNTKLKVLIEEEKKIENDLAQAQEQVVKEKEELNNLKESFNTSFPLYVTASEQYKNVATVVEKTDVFFNNPNTEPKIILKTKTLAIEKSINEKRANINELLASWKEKTDASLANKVTRNTIKELTNEALIIKYFVSTLNQIVQNLTPENSGLTQSAINNYETVIEEITGTINNTVTILENTQASPGSAVTPETPAQNEAVNTNLTTNGSTQTQTETVTLDQITTQEEVVIASEAQVVALEEALAQVQEEIAQETQATTETNNPVPDPSPLVPDTSSPAPDTSGSPTNSVEQNVIPGQDSFPDPILQPGQPKLIQD